MRRTNIYLADEQLATLQRASELRGRPVAELVREAIDSWLDSEGLRTIPEDEWQRRFDSLLARRKAIAGSVTASDEEIERDIGLAVREVRRARAARRR